MVGSDGNLIRGRVLTDVTEKSKMWKSRVTALLFAFCGYVVINIRKECRCFGELKYIILDR